MIISSQNQIEVKMCNLQLHFWELLKQCFKLFCKIEYLHWKQIKRKDPLQLLGRSFGLLGKSLPLLGCYWNIAILKILLDTIYYDHYDRLVLNLPLLTRIVMTLFSGADSHLFSVWNILIWAWFELGLLDTLCRDLSVGTMKSRISARGVHFAYELIWFQLKIQYFRHEILSFVHLLLRDPERELITIGGSVPSDRGRSGQRCHECIEHPLLSP